MDELAAYPAQQLPSRWSQDEGDMTISMGVRGAGSLGGDETFQERDTRTQLLETIYIQWNHRIVDVLGTVVMSLIRRLNLKWRLHSRLHYKIYGCA